jgi:phosphoenolpyruvate carboxykinase (ATP)
VLENVVMDEETRALDGSLKNVEFRKDPNFGFEVPVSVPGVDTSILDPRSTWADQDEYDRTAAKLVDLFVANFAEFAPHVDEGVRQSGPVQAQQQMSQGQPTPA